jgi:hypothetical protein
VARFRNSCQHTLIIIITTQVCLSIQLLLQDPNPDDPLDPQIAKKWKEVCFLSSPFAHPHVPLLLSLTFLFVFYTLSHPFAGRSVFCPLLSAISTLIIPICA